MRTARDVPLAPLTTLRLGGPARTFVEAATDDELVGAVRDADAAGEPVLLLAGGSNLVLADAGFAGTVVAVRTRGVEVEDDRLVVAAGEDWDPLVARCVERGLAGFECLSGIPGSVGATPIQNVGAYGQEVAERSSPSVLRPDGGRGVQLAPGALRLRLPHQRVQGERALRRAVRGLRAGRGEPTPIRYAELAGALGVEVGERAPIADAVRRAVLALRRGKGMVLDPGDPDTVSAGSFFMNPVLTTEAVRRACETRTPAPPPGFPDGDGHVKTSAAWLIDRAGFGRATVTAARACPPSTRSR